MTADWQRQLDAIVDERHDWMVALRRHLHAHPEPSGEELKTSLHLYQQLGEEGLAVTMGPDGRGVIVDSPSCEDRRFALRADIDALKIQDRKNTPYRSRTPGVMHACGHDAHTAILCGTAVSLAELERRGLQPWPICWRGIFQPSEETATGAVEMIRAGALEGVDAILAAHVDPTRTAGKIAVCRGPMTANCDAMSIKVHGRGGHAARPHESNDPIAAAAQLISTIYQFVPRATDSFDAVVVTIGEVRGGDNPNVIPEHVVLRGTLRTLDRAVRERTMHHIYQLARGIEEISGTRIELEFQTSILSIDNDAQLVNLVVQALGLRRTGQTRAASASQHGERRLLLLLGAHPRSVVSTRLRDGDHAGSGPAHALLRHR